jgi:hypothetical protein
MRLVRGAFPSGDGSAAHYKQCSFSEQIAFPTTLFAGLNFRRAEHYWLERIGFACTTRAFYQLEAIER